MKHICVLGSINIDLVINVERIPAVGETVFGLRLEKFPGGKGANQAVSARRLGQKVTLIGRVGDDENGRFLRDLLIKEGMDIQHVIVDSSESTGIAFINVDQHGGNNIIVVSGANIKILTMPI